MLALNFYSDLYADALRRGRKTATVRLGDKRDKYQAGQVVLVTVGRRFGPRKKLFAAIIDQVDVKQVGELTNIEVEKENPEFRSSDEVMTLLKTRPDAPEICVENVKRLRFAAEGGHYAETFQAFNDAMAHR